MIIDFSPPPSALKLSIRFSKLAFVAFCQAAPTRRHFVEKKNQMKFREKKIRPTKNIQYIINRHITFTVSFDVP